MKYSAILFFFVFSFCAKSQYHCDPLNVWTSAEPQLPNNNLDSLSVVHYSDTINDELYLLTSLNVGNYEILKLDTLNNAWDTITSFQCNGTIHCFKIYDDKYFIGGDFSIGFNWTNIAYFNDTVWNNVSAIDTLLPPGGFTRVVRDMERYKGELYICGSYVDPSLVSFNGIAKYDGNNWMSLGLGLEAPYPAGYAYASGFALEVHDSLLYVGGNFEMSTTVSNKNIAAWDGNNWLPVSISDLGVLHLASSDTCLFAHSYRYISGNCANKISYLSNGQWGNLLTDSSCFSQVFELATLNNQLFVSGEFYDSISNVSRIRVSKFEQDHSITRLSDFYAPSNANHLFNYRNDLMFSCMSTSCGTSIYGMAKLCDSIECSLISGTVFNDQNQDCINNSEPGMANAIITLQPNQYIMCDSSGYYQKWVTPGNYSLNAPSIPWQTNVCNPSGITLNVQSGQTYGNNDFGLHVIPNIEDLQLSITQGPARVGFETVLYVNAKNIGTTSLNASVEINWDSILLYNTATVPLINTGLNSFTWNVGNLNVNEFKNAELYFDVPADINLLGTILQTSGVGTITNTDPDLTNNRDSIFVEITAAYDPNIKEVTPTGDTSNNNSGLIEMDVDQFTYTIHFQNTGSDTAFNIYIRDEIDSHLELSTLNVLASSHDVSLNLIGNNMLEFKFDNILLPDSNVNYLGSMGYIKYRIESKPGVVEGDQIKNFAEIFFDYNPPIITNTTINTYVILSSNSDDLIQDNQLSLAPNPFSNSTVVKIPIGATSEQYLEFQIIDLQGKVIKQEKIGKERVFEINRGNLNSGVYFLRVYSGQELVGTRKLIIE